MHWSVGNERGVKKNRFGSVDELSHCWPFDWWGYCFGTDTIDSFWLVYWELVLQAFFSWRWCALMSPTRVCWLLLNWTVPTTTSLKWQVQIIDIDAIDEQTKMSLIWYFYCALVWKWQRNKSTCHFLKFIPKFLRFFILIISHSVPSFHCIIKVQQIFVQWVWFGISTELL